MIVLGNIIVSNHFWKISFLSSFFKLRITENRELNSFTLLCFQPEEVAYMDKIMLIPDSSDDEVWFSDTDVAASGTQSGERKNTNLSDSYRK